MAMFCFAIFHSWILFYPEPYWVEGYNPLIELNGGYSWRLGQLHLENSEHQRVSLCEATVY